jgi:hypothetical protein
VNWVEVMLLTAAIAYGCFVPLSRSLWDFSGPRNGFLTTRHWSNGTVLLHQGVQEASLSDRSGSSSIRCVFIVRTIRAGVVLSSPGQGMG